MRILHGVITGAAGAVFALALASSPAGAQVLLDPATLHTGPGAGTACATGGCPLYMGEVNAIGASEFDLYQQSNGAGSINPLLLIFAVPNNPTNSIGSSNVTGAQPYNPYPGGSPVTLGVPSPGTTAYGLNIGSSGLAGEMTSGDVYGFLGGDLADADNSNSFTNLSQWDSALLGITADNFSIYVFSVDLTGTAGFGGQDLVNVDISNVPLGTFVLGFGEDANGTIYANPFTEAGLDNTPGHGAPEPASLAIFGAALAGFGFVSRRRRKSV